MSRFPISSPRRAAHAKGPDPTPPTDPYAAGHDSRLALTQTLSLLRGQKKKDPEKLPKGCLRVAAAAVAAAAAFTGCRWGSCPA